MDALKLVGFCVALFIGMVALAQCSGTVSCSFDSHKVDGMNHYTDMGMDY